MGKTTLKKITLPKASWVSSLYFFYPIPKATASGRGQFPIVLHAALFSFFFISQYINVRALRLCLRQCSTPEPAVDDGGTVVRAAVVFLSILLLEHYRWLVSNRINSTFDCYFAIFAVRSNILFLSFLPFLLFIKDLREIVLIKINWE